MIFSFDGTDSLAMASHSAKSYGIWMASKSFILTTGADKQANGHSFDEWNYFP